MQNVQTRFIQLLKWSEKYFKTDVRYLASGGFWSALSYVIQVGFGIVTTVVLARVLAPEALGTYQFIIAMAGIISVFSLTGMGTAIIRAVAQGNEGTLRSGVSISLKWSFGIVAAAVLIASYYWYQGNNVLAIAFLLIGAFVPLTESFILYESYLRGKQAFRDEVMLGLWRKPLPLVALLLTLYFTQHVPTLIGVYFAANALSTIWVYRLTIKKYQPPDTPHLETILYSKQLSIMNVLFRVSEYADKVLLWYLLGPVAVATFSIAQLAVKYSGGLASVVSNVALPKVSQRDLATLQATLPRKVWLFTLALLPFMVGYVLLVPFVFQILFPDYPDAVPLSQVLGILFIFLPRSLYGHVLIAHEQTKALYIGSTLAPIIKLASLAILIYFFGVWGAVYALIFSEAILMLIGWYLFTTARAPRIRTAQP